LHCFLDTETFWARAAEERERLPELARNTRTRLYFPEAGIIERVRQLFRDLKKYYEGVRPFG
jgi:hypothetical protein